MARKKLSFNDHDRNVYRVCTDETKTRLSL